MDRQVLAILVYRTGGDYTREYVERLAASLTPQFGPVLCLTDDFELVSDPCSGLVAYHMFDQFPGWWSKIEMFRVFSDMGCRFLYFDLDTVITGRIDISALNGVKFAMLSDFYKPERPASGVMYWEGDFSFLYDGFEPSRMYEFKTADRWGDQGYIAEKLSERGIDPERLQNLLPGTFASYKASTPAQKAGASVICYHGRPRPHETGWKI